MSITFLTLLCSPAPCKNSKNTPGLENIIRTRLLVFSENKIRTKSIWIFCVFLWCQGLCWPLYNPHISCNAIVGSYERSAMTMTPQTHLKTTYKTNFFWRKCEKGGEVKNEGNCWRSKPFYSLKSVISTVKQNVFHNQNCPKMH